MDDVREAIRLAGEGPSFYRMFILVECFKVYKRIALVEIQGEEVALGLLFLPTGNSHCWLMLY